MKYSEEHMWSQRILGVCLAGILLGCIVILTDFYSLASGGLVVFAVLALTAFLGLCRTTQRTAAALEDWALAADHLPPPAVPTAWRPLVDTLAGQYASKKDTEERLRIESARAASLEQALARSSALAEKHGAQYDGLDMRVRSISLP